VRGYLERIEVKEGQQVKQGQLMFKIQPTLYQAKLDADKAEANLANIKYQMQQQLHDKTVGGKPVVSPIAVQMAGAEYKKAEAQVALAQTEVSFTDIKAPYDGIIDRLYEMQGSLIDEGDMLTTLSDNDVMWVYFNVPEARYLEYMQAEQSERESNTIELQLANGETFKYPGKIAAIEGQFNNETGNIPFRADFENPQHLLRHGQTGNILIHHTLHDAIVIPQRAVFEVLDKLYVYVIEKDGTVRQREITVKEEQEDIFVIASGLDVNDKFVLEGIRQVQDGEKVEYEFMKPEEALSHLKYHAE
jgi:membrane fusion protein (multidrug efflux system)